MATVDTEQDTYRNWLDQENQQNGRVPDMSAPTPAPIASLSRDQVDAQAKARLGSLYDPTVTDDILRNASYNGGSDTQSWIDRVVNKNLLRAGNESGSQYTPNGMGGFMTGPTGKTETTNQAITAAQRQGGLGITQWGPPSVAAQGGFYGSPWAVGYRPTPDQLNPGSAYQGGSQAGLGAAGGAGMSYPGNQFSDPYTSMLETIIKSQLGQAQQPVNSAPYDTLSNFLTSRFNDLSQSPGYSPAELALLKTQASEPIEDLRTASRNRAMQRAAAAGFLPTSGISQLTQGQNGLPETLDTAYDRMRTQSARDLAINAINQRRQDLNQAGTIGGQVIGLQNQQFGDQQQRNNVALNLATLLQQLPAQAQAEALAVINGTASPANLLGTVAQITQQNRQNTFNQWAGIGSWIDRILNNG